VIVNKRKYFFSRSPFILFNLFKSFIFNRDRRNNNNRGDRQYNNSNNNNNRNNNSERPSYQQKSNYDPNYQTSDHQDSNANNLGFNNKFSNLKIDVGDVDDEVDEE
jgi:hypothetical protein